MCTPIEEKYGKFIDIDGTKTYYQKIGVDEYPAIIFLHGFLSSSYAWRKVADELMHKYCLYILDLPGYGSSVGNLTSYSVESYSIFLRAFCTKLKIEQFTLVGAQMGGSIAAWFTSQYTGQVKNLVVISAGALGENKTNMFLYKALASRTLGYLITRLFTFKLFAKRWRAAHVKIDVATDDVVNVYYKNFKKSGNLQAKIGLQVRSSYGRDFKLFEKPMRQIKTPTLLIWGENDPLVPLSTAYKFNHLISLSQLNIISNCGDFPHEEYPEVVAKDIDIFVSK
jgi:pimeloyl-ACP methyl ester carboxylesterase